MHIWIGHECLTWLSEWKMDVRWGKARTSWNPQARARQTETLYR